MSDTFHDSLRTAILDEKRFVEAVFQGARRGAAVPWARITIRPVEVKGSRRLQFTTFDGAQERSRNLTADEARGQLDELLALPFNSLLARTTALARLVGAAHPTYGTLLRRASHIRFRRR